MALLTAAAVGFGGAVGAITRFAVGNAIERRAMDTLAVNVLGSVLLGVVLSADGGSFVVPAAGVGFCGAFTTFSSFAVETVRLAEEGRQRTAFAVGVGTLVLALLGVLVGGALGGVLGGLA